MEFVIMLAVAMMLFGIIAAFIVQRQTSFTQDLERIQLEDYTYAFQQEFFLAAVMHDGYQRNISLPDEINNKPYSIQILNSNLYVAQSGYDIIVALPNVTGMISPPDLLIRKIDGQVTVS
jgi:type II secretory pathway pseudopilin PulG